MNSAQPFSDEPSTIDYEARIRELEESRDQYQEWAVDYEQRIANAKAILKELRGMTPPDRNAWSERYIDQVLAVLTVK